MAENQPEQKINIENIEREYKAFYGLADNFSKELSNQLAKLLSAENIPLGFPIQIRVKSWESIVEKIHRLPLSIKSVKDFQDIVGLRIILLYKRDVEKVCETISKNLKVLNQYDPKEKLSEDQFGYSSIHFVVELPDDWLRVPSFASMGGLLAEIQVRTLAQHIWAEISHQLQYKQQDSVPPAVRRSIHRVSALLETVDLEFSRVLEERELYKSEIVQSQIQEKLNVDLLENVLDSLLPKENKKEGEPYADLLEELIHCEIKTQQDLVNLAKKHLKAAIETDRKRANVELEQIKKGEGTLNERIKKGVFYTHVGLMRDILRSEFGDKLNIFMAKRHSKKQNLTTKAGAT